MEDKISFSVSVTRATAASLLLWATTATAALLISLGQIDARHSLLAVMPLAFGNAICASRRLARERAAFEAGFEIGERVADAGRPTLVR